MQKIYTHPIEHSGRKEVFDYLDTLKKQNPKLTVLDIGASHNSWLKYYTTHTFDLNEDLINLYQFKGNINDYEDWVQIFDWVDKNGKFDFASCTHTLEDVAYPQITLKYLPRIAKEGFIAVPSHFQELERRYGFRGEIHHRWIFTNKENILVGMPKLSIVEYIEKFADSESLFKENGHLELRMWWKDTLEFKIINNDYMGPTPEAVVQMYINNF